MSFVFAPSRRRAVLFACSLGALMLGAVQGQASSSDAWKEFQDEVREACVASAGDAFEVKNVEVDPYGSESYGYAVLFGSEKGSTDQSMLVCAYDKQTQAAEVSAPFGM